MPQWDYPGGVPYSIYACEQPYDKAPTLTPCKLREPLRSPDHIRLLKIYPPGWPSRHHLEIPHEADTDVECDIFQVPLADVTTKGRPYFATLSYAWGEGKPSRTMRCGNTVVKVTQNLHDALVYVRHSKRPRLLWVDNLCVNQKRDREKSEQVQRMHLIYGQSHCISWLGVENEKRDLHTMVPILELFSRMSEEFDKHRTMISWVAAQKYYEHSPIKGHPTIYHFPWVTLCKCLEWKLFTRLWCVQEVMMARSNEYRTSKTLLNITVLARSCHILSYLFRLEGVSTALALEENSKSTGDQVTSPQVLVNQFENINTQFMVAALPGLKFKKSKGPKASAISVPLRFGWKNCTNPRDHVYGLSALCGAQTSFKINYSHTVQQVFVKFVLHHLHRNKSLWHLSSLWSGQAIHNSRIYYEDTSHRSWIDNLPSWCPQFSGPIYRRRHLLERDYKKRGQFKACSGRPSRCTIMSLRTLGVTGFLVSTVLKCGLPAYPEYMFEDHTSYQHSSQLRRASWQHVLLQENRFLIQHLWKTYHEVCFAGDDFRSYNIWSRVRERLPPKTRDRMAVSIMGTAWLVKEFPELVSKAGLSLSQTFDPEICSQIQKHLQGHFVNANVGCRLFTASNPAAFLGTGPAGMHVGDIVTCLYGCNVPIILRQVGNKGHYKVIGECYVSGIMYGEALRMGLEEREFLLI